MPHILLAGKLHPAGLALLDHAPGVTYDHVEDVTEAAYAPLVPRADAIVIRTQPMSAKTIAAGNRLRLVSRHGVGFDAVDVGALSARQIPLCVVGDVNSVSVAEHALMLILAASRRLVAADRAVRGGDWAWRNRLEARDIAGRRLLVVGFGRIGRHVARLAGAFGMEVRAFDPFLAARGWPAGPVAAAATLDDGLGWADIVSVNLPRADRPVLGRAEIARMRPGGVVVNTARGGIVDEAALAEALASGHLAAAGLDVFETEPPAPGHPLLACPTAVLTPHQAGLTREAAERLAMSSVQNVLDFFAGRLDPDLIVNKDALN